MHPKPIFYLNHDYSMLHCKESELHIFNKPMLANARPISDQYQINFLQVFYWYHTDLLLANYEQKTNNPYS